MSLARWLLAVWAEMPARAASSPAGRASPPARDRHMAAREGSARRFATNAMLGSVIEAKLSAFGARDVSPRAEDKYQRAAGASSQYSSPIGCPERSLMVGVTPQSGQAGSRRSLTSRKRMPSAS